MNIYPAIDLRNGQIVRLFQGDFQKTTIYPQNPVEQARNFLNSGAQFLHVVDLDGAKTGSPGNQDVIEAIVKTKIKVQCGGGIRSIEDVRKLLNIGVHRVVIGSLTVENETVTKNIFQEFGADSITISTDLNIDDSNRLMLATGGWQHQSSREFVEVIETYLPVGLKRILVTDISRDGTLQGPNIQLYKQISKIFPDIEILASGGVGSLADAKQLKKIGIYGVIVGKALYEQRFSLESLLSC